MQPGDSGAGSEESAAKAAEETPVGEVETSIKGDWQLSAPSVGDAASGTKAGEKTAETGITVAAAMDADPGDGPEESASKAGEETPAGNVETAGDGGWQLGAPSVGDAAAGDDTTVSAPGGDGQSEAGADAGGGAEESAQVRRSRVALEMSSRALRLSSPDFKLCIDPSAVHNAAL